MSVCLSVLTKTEIYLFGVTISSTSSNSYQTFTTSNIFAKKAPLL